MRDIKNLGQLKASGYLPKSIKDELRQNLIQKLKSKTSTFEGILGFEDSVIPDLERAILSRHNILLLGLRGQAKTRLARLMVNLLDEYIPVIAGSELNDDPMQPVSRYGIDMIREHGDETPVAWMHRSERYVEKLATPDVSVADLIGDVDPIIAATLKLPYSDERVIHFGLIPRAHRCIFVINELPDLQARIQVSLFNILQEGDIQIRGFKLRLPLEIEFVFTANPEDYTNRGSIITPLKDRIQSQILTHYPEEIETAIAITRQEAKPEAAQISAIAVSDKIRKLIEQIAFEARESELIDQKSGVSARLTISAFEHIMSSAERRMILNDEKNTRVRISDVWNVIPAITGKVELVYEGEQEGPESVAIALIEDAVDKMFLEFFPNPEDLKPGMQRDPYDAIKMWFADHNLLELNMNDSDADFVKKLDQVPGLKKLAQSSNVTADELPMMMELILHGLSEYNIINKQYQGSGFKFNDDLSDMFDDLQDN